MHIHLLFRLWTVETRGCHIESDGQEELVKFGEEFLHEEQEVKAAKERKET